MGEERPSLSAPPQRSQRGRGVVFSGAVAFLAACGFVSSAVTRGRSDRRHIVATDTSVVKLWNSALGSGGGSDGLRSQTPSVLEHLWKVERILVDQDVGGLCSPANKDVEDLRKMTWPLPDAGPAPKIAKVVYINLAWDIVRRNYMEDQLANVSEIAWNSKRYRLSWERQAALQAADLEHASAYAGWRSKGFSQAESPDVRGDWRTAACAYSHYTAISNIAEAPGSDLIVIAEDDVEFNPHFVDAWEAVWPFVPPDWDILRIGWFSDYQNCSQTVNERIDRAGWQDPRTGECAYCGAQAYIVNPTSEEKVLRRFELSRITHADELLGAPTPQLEDPRLVEDLKAYVIWPMMARIHFQDGVPAFASDRMEGRMALKRK